MQKHWPSVCLLVLLAAAPARAGLRELSAIEAADAVLKPLTADPRRGIPPAVLLEARGVVIRPLS